MDQDTLRVLLREAARETVTGAEPDSPPADTRGLQERLLPQEASSWATATPTRPSAP